MGSESIRLYLKNWNSLGPKKQQQKQTENKTKKKPIPIIKNTCASLLAPLYCRDECY